MYSKEPEFRLNYLKNFNHFNKDQMGAMGIFGPRSNSEINRMNDEIFDTDEDEEDYEEEYGEEINVEDDNNNGLVIGGEGEIIPRTHSYPYGFGSPPSQTFKDDTGIRSKTSATIFTFENFTNIDLDLDFKEIHSVSDGHFNMILKDIEKKGNGIILKVHFEEVENNKFNGAGTFRYIPSNIKGLIGDIYPIKLDGILEDVFLDNPESIMDFMIQMIIDIKL